MYEIDRAHHQSAALECQGCNDYYPTQNKNQFIKAVRNLILIIPKFQNIAKENASMPDPQATLDEFDVL